MSKDRKKLRWYETDSDIDWDSIKKNDSGDITFCTSNCIHFNKAVRNDGRVRSTNTPDTGRCGAVNGKQTVYAGSSGCLSPESRTS